MFRDAFRAFVQQEVAPYHSEWEKVGHVPRELWLKAGEKGFLCMDVPEAYGGMGVFDDAFAAFGQCRRVAEEIDLKSVAVQIPNMLGWLHHELGDYAGALVGQVFEPVWTWDINGCVRMAAGVHVLAADLGPLAGLPKLLSDSRREDLLDVRTSLWSEAAADRRGYDSQIRSIETHLAD